MGLKVIIKYPPTMAGIAKLSIHMSVVIVTIVLGLMLKKEKIQIAIEPFKMKSNTDKIGVIEAIKYTPPMEVIASKY